MHIATFCSDAAIQSLSERSGGYSAPALTEPDLHVPNQFTLHCDVLPARRIVAVPPLFIEKVMPFWAKR